MRKETYECVRKRPTNERKRRVFAAFPDATGTARKETYRCAYRDVRMQVRVSDVKGPSNERKRRVFAAFADATGVEILEHFAAADMSSIRNKSGYLKGVMNRFRISEKKEKKERKLKEEESGAERAAAAAGDRCTSVFVLLYQ